MSRDPSDIAREQREDELMPRPKEPEPAVPAYTYHFPRGKVQPPKPRDN